MDNQDNQEKQSTEIGIAAKKLIGMEVYTINEGDSLGNVKDLLIDPMAKKAVAFLVEKKGLSREARLIPFDKVVNIGDAAVIVADRGSVARAANLPHMVKYLERPAALYGTRIITTQGVSLGRMEEYHIHRKTGAICQLDIIGGKGHALSGRASLDGQYLLTMGRAAIMVEAANAQALINRESQLEQVVTEVKEKAGQAWQSTVTAGRRLGQNLSASINKLLDEEIPEEPTDSGSETPGSEDSPSENPTAEIKIEPTAPVETNSPTEETKTVEIQVEATKEEEIPKKAAPKREKIPAPVSEPAEKPAVKPTTKSQDKKNENEAKKEKKTAKKTEKIELCPPPEENTSFEPPPPKATD